MGVGGLMHDKMSWFCEAEEQLTGHVLKPLNQNDLIQS